MLRKILNSYGLSLMEMVIGAALSGVVGLLVVQQFRQQDKFKQEMENDQIVNELRRAFLKGFHNPASCGNTLRQDTNPTTNFIPGSVTITSIRSAGPSPHNVMYRVNVPFDGNRFVIRKIDTSFNQMSGELTVSVDVEDLRKSPKGLFSSIAQRRMLPPIEFEVDVTQEPNTHFFVECSADSPDSLKFCTGPGAIYDNLTDECMIMAPDISQPTPGSGLGSNGVSLDLFSGMVLIRNNGFAYPGGIDCRQAPYGPGYFLYFNSATDEPECRQFQMTDFEHLLDINLSNCEPPNNRYSIKYDPISDKLQIYCDDPVLCTPVNCAYSYTPGACQVSNGCKTGCRIHNLTITTPASCGGTPCPPFTHCPTDPTCSNSNQFCSPTN